MGSWTNNPTSSSVTCALAFGSAHPTPVLDLDADIEILNALMLSSEFISNEELD